MKLGAASHEARRRVSRDSQDRFLGSGIATVPSRAPGRTHNAPMCPRADHRMPGYAMEPALSKGTVMKRSVIIPLALGVVTAAGVGTAALASTGTGSGAGSTGTNTLAAAATGAKQSAAASPATAPASAKQPAASTPTSTSPAPTAPAATTPATAADESAKRCDLRPWADRVEGQPAGFDAHDKGGDYLWHNKDGFHLRATHRHDDRRVYTGSITVPTAIIDVRPVKLEAQDKVWLSADHRTLHFRLADHGWIDGADFRTACATTLTVSHLKTGTSALPADRVYLGDSKVHPAHTPFTVHRES
jgi:hypothetical protein